MRTKLKKTIQSDGLVSGVKETLKKSLYYSTIAATALGTSVSFLPTMSGITADAAAITLTNARTASAGDADGNTTADDDITAADTYILNGANGNFATSNTAITIASLTSANANSATAITGAGGLIVTGNVVGTLDLAITPAAASALTIQGNVTEGSGKAVTVVLPGSKVTFSGGAQAIASKVDSDNGNDGTMTISNAGIKTFSDTVGAIKVLDKVTIGTGSSAVFSGALDSDDVVNLGTVTFSAATGIDVLTNSGTVILNNAIDDLAANGLASIVMHTQGSVLSMLDGTTRDHDMVVTATTDGFGIINVIDDGGGQAAAQVTSGGDIGTANIHIGTINIGSTTKAGALTTIDGDAIHVDTLNIVGGNATTENSILIAAESVTANTAIFLKAASVGDAELNISDAATITGSIDMGTGTDGAGDTIIDVDANATFASNIGSTTPVEIMTVANSVKATMAGAVVSIDSMVLTDAGNIDMTGAVAQTLTGAITLDADGDGVLHNSNTAGMVTIASAVGVEASRIGTITLDDGASTTFQSVIHADTLAVAGDALTDLLVLEVNGNVIGNNGGTNAGALTFAGGSTIILGETIIAGETVFDISEVTAGAGGVAIAGNILIKPAANFTSGTITFADGDAATLSTDDQARVLVNDNALVDYSVVTTTADISITASFKDAATTGSELGVTNNMALATQQAMDALNTNGDTALVTAFNNALSNINSGSIADIKAVGKQVAPQQDSIVGSAAALKANTNAVQGVISNRMASLRSGDAYVAGMSAGDGVSANSMFLQAFGSVVEQDSKIVGAGHQPGYDADTSGVAVGLDAITDGGLVVGLSVSMSNTDLEGKGTGKATNDIDSYTASLYMDKSSDVGYVEGSLTFGISENANSRLINTAGIDRSYKGEYDTQQVSVKLGGGLPYEANNGAYVTPFASVTGTLIEADAYTETSNTAGDALRLRVDQDDINSIKGTLGIKAHMDTGNGTPMISLAVNNEFGDTDLVTTNTFQGGGAAFKTTTAVEELSATLGLGYAFTNGNTELNVGYEAEANEDDYLGHYGTVKLTSKF
jgi:hypothetical protein